MIIGISGASGAIYGIRLVEVLQKIPDVEVHLVVSEWARKTIEIETTYALGQLFSMAHTTHDNRDMAAPIASGTFSSAGMIVVPASNKTVAGIACGYSSNLIIRAADVAIKEKRKLVLVPRETPMSAIHLENLLKLARLGVVVLPAVPGFYTKPETIDDLIDFTVGKILDQFGIDHDLYERWGEVY